MQDDYGHDDVVYLFDGPMTGVSEHEGHFDRFIRHPASLTEEGLRIHRNTKPYTTVREITAEGKDYEDELLKYVERMLQKR